MNCLVATVSVPLWLSGWETSTLTGSPVALLGETPRPHWLTILVLAIASVLDYIIGDPWDWPHPVQAIGWVISRYSHYTLQWVAKPNIRRIAGVGLGIGAIAGTGLIAGGMIQVARSLHPGLGFTLEIILLASCFAGRSLRDAAEDVLKPLAKGTPPSPPSQGGANDKLGDVTPPSPPSQGGANDDLEEARQKLRLYVGRDTENLSQAEIMRAILETVSENAVDGVMAPLFYAIVGAWIPGVGPVPLAIAYKAASTLDSMVGYRTEPYKDLGWFSAKFEDVLTWLPCRLTVMTIGLISGNLLGIWQTCEADATKDPSPNAGWSECAYAVALGVQLGGSNSYGGVIKEKPLLGQPLHPIAPDKIQQALQLTRYSFLIWLAIGCIVHIAA